MPDPDHTVLIRHLAEELRPVRRLSPPWLRASFWLLLWLALAVAITGALGVQETMGKLVGSMGEAGQFAAAAVTAITAAMAAFMLSVPGRSARWALLPMPSLALWIVAACAGCLMAQAGPGGAAPAPTTCFRILVLISLPLSLVLLLMLRRAYSIRPGLTAIMAGIASAAASAVLVDLMHATTVTVADLVAHAAALLVIVGLNRLVTTRALALTALLLVAAAGAQAADTPVTPPASRPILVELFTAQGCSSCPPADELLNELVRTRKDLLPLSLHVDYWNRMGWNDPFSSPEATERQRLYASRATDPTLFTPQMIVDGTKSAIGSDIGQVDEAVGAALDEAVTLAPVSLTTSGKEVVVTVGAGTGTADIVLVGYDRSHTTSVSRGENTGRKLTEMNVVRSIQSIGDWTGAALTLRRPMPAGQLRAVLLAAPDGRIVGLAAPGH